MRRIAGAWIISSLESDISNVLAQILDVYLSEFELVKEVSCIVFLFESVPRLSTSREEKEDAADY